MNITTEQNQIPCRFPPGLNGTGYGRDEQIFSPKKKKISTILPKFFSYSNNNLVIPIPSFFLCDTEIKKKTHN